MTTILLTGDEYITAIPVVGDVFTSIPGSDKVNDIKVLYTPTSRDDAVRATDLYVLIALGIVLWMIV